MASTNTSVDSSLIGPSFCCAEAAPESRRTIVIATIFLQHDLKIINALLNSPERQKARSTRPDEMTGLSVA
jgi:hypothetical protein